LCVGFCLGRVRVSRRIQQPEQHPIGVFGKDSPAVIK
jgi:hypothetical protein